MSSSPRHGYCSTPCSAPQILFSEPLALCYESTGASPLQSSIFLPVYENLLVPTTRQNLGSSYGHDSCAPYRTDCMHLMDTTSGKVDEPPHSSCDHLIEEPHSEKHGHRSVDVNMRKKNTTRETTSTLKTWLQEHKRNPYPTKGEKIMLAIITKMTLTQVSTWFANARRRLKKENKMTWLPRAKTSDKICNKDGGDIDDETFGSHTAFRDLPSIKAGNNLKKTDFEDFDPIESGGLEYRHKAANLLMESFHPVSSTKHQDFVKTCSEFKNSSMKTIHSQHDKFKCDVKAKIWSLAQTATSCVCRRHTTMTSSSMDCSSDLVITQHDSPVTMLTNWVDGMFQDPSFQ